MALIRIELVSHNPSSLALFYQTALGFTRAEPNAESTTDPAPCERLGLRHGDSSVDLIAFIPPGHAYPPGQAANSLSFQHFAIITPDIAAAYATLRGVAGWRPISATGPVQLPASSGGAIAFKFRDPEGHPLELLQLPSDNTPRIDHSAIVVSDTAACLAFYKTFGLDSQGGSHNHGPAQAALDGLEGADVTVTRLGDGADKLHLELLCYHGPSTPRSPQTATDVAATRLVFDSGSTGLRTDPDGHHLLFAPHHG